MAMSLKALVKRFAREERGASMIEYAVLVGIVTALIVAAVATMGDNIVAIFNDINGSLSSTAART